MSTKQEITVPKMGAMGETVASHFCKDGNGDKDSAIGYIPIPGKHHTHNSCSHVRSAAYSDIGTKRVTPCSVLTMYFKILLHRSPCLPTSSAFKGWQSQNPGFWKETCRLCPLLQTARLSKARSSSQETCFHNSYHLIEGKTLYV